MDLVVSTHPPCLSCTLTNTTRVRCWPVDGSHKAPNLIKMVKEVRSNRIQAILYTTNYSCNVVTPPDLVW